MSRLTVCLCGHGPCEYTSKWKCLSEATNWHCTSHVQCQANFSDHLCRNYQRNWDWKISSFTIGRFRMRYSNMVQTALRPWVLEGISFPELSHMMSWLVSFYVSMPQFGLRTHRLLIFWDGWRKIWAFVVGVLQLAENIKSFCENVPHPTACCWCGTFWNMPNSRKGHVAGTCDPSNHELLQGTNCAFPHWRANISCKLNQNVKVEGKHLFPVALLTRGWIADFVEPVEGDATRDCTSRGRWLWPFDKNPRHPTDIALLHDTMSTKNEENIFQNVPTTPFRLQPHPLDNSTKCMMADQNSHYAHLAHHESYLLNSFPGRTFIHDSSVFLERCIHVDTNSLCPHIETFRGEVRFT